jgi:hypothetical protein
MTVVDFSTFVKVESQLPPKDPDQLEDEGEEDILELPEFTKSLSLKSSMSMKEKANMPPVNGDKPKAVQ